MYALIATKNKRCSAEIISSSLHRNCLLLVVWVLFSLRHDDKGNPKIYPLPDNSLSPCKDNTISSLCYHQETFLPLPALPSSQSRRDEDFCHTPPFQNKHPERKTSHCRSTSKPTDPPISLGIRFLPRRFQQTHFTRAASPPCSHRTLLAKSVFFFRRAL